jgi:NAD(P) transhydrogenase subunit alpha
MESLQQFEFLFFIFILAMFLGLELITKVPSQLHTPLMSGSNAISGISLVGALVVAGEAGTSTLTTILGAAAVGFAMINVVGGYLVTDRMLAMFRVGKAKRPAAQEKGEGN